MMRRSTSNRRLFLKSFLALFPAGVISSKASAAVRTPPTTAGPFYPTDKMRFADIDNDLVKISGLDSEAEGEIITFGGRILNEQGKPLANARVEIWQCDANGHYLHSGDPSKAKQDDGFQGFGHYVTGLDGAYNFRTIMPVPYPGRTPHIHMKVIHAGKELVTQLYVAGHNQNSGDVLFKRLSEQQRNAVEMRFSDSAGAPHAEVNIVV
ncbi:MAG: protocatechuate 3,4-dioxygenase [Hyphomicrobiales bacterium]